MKPLEWVFILAVVGILVESTMLMSDAERTGALAIFLVLALLSGIILSTNPSPS